MIKVSVLYPWSIDGKFDMAYYIDKHIPLVRQKLGAACKGVAVEHGLTGGAPGEPPAYTAMGHLLFDSVEAFEATFAPHAKAILDDVSNYTTIQPVIQISDVKL